jgi:hypothetical protein
MLLIIMMSVIMLSVVMLGVALFIIILNVIMPSAVMLRVVAPICHYHSLSPYLQARLSTSTCRKSHSGRLHLGSQILYYSASSCREKRLTITVIKVL